MVIESSLGKLIVSISKRFQIMGNFAGQIDFVFLLQLIRRRHTTARRDDIPERSNKITGAPA
jgi:hypothetical protein